MTYLARPRLSIYLNYLPLPKSRFFEWGLLLLDSAKGCSPTRTGLPSSPSRCYTRQHRLRAVLLTSNWFISLRLLAGTLLTPRACLQTKEGVDFVRCYALNDRAIAFRRALDAGRPGMAKRGQLALAPRRPPQKSAALQLYLPFQREDIFGSSMIFGDQAMPPRVGPAAPPRAATPFYSWYIGGQRGTDCSTLRSLAARFLLPSAAVPTSALRRPTPLRRSYALHPTALVRCRGGNTPGAHRPPPSWPLARALAIPSTPVPLLPALPSWEPVLESDGPTAADPGAVAVVLAEPLAPVPSVDVDSSSPPGAHPPKTLPCLLPKGTLVSARRARSASLARRARCGP